MDSFRTMAGLALAAIALGAHAQEPQKLRQARYKVCGVELRLEEARTSQERALGLMHRAGIEAGTGMIFVFERPEPLEFWMRNVAFDIDIGFFDKRGRLLKTHLMKGTSLMMNSDALPRYPSGGPAQFAVEVEPGFYSKVRTKNCKLSPIPKL
jgi:uncharacterized membrane protein (UPF0127 family)